MNLLARDALEVDAGDLLLHRQRLKDVKESLRNHWPVRSEEPLIGALDLLRDSILRDVEISERLIEASIATMAHEPCDDESCPLPCCREEHDRLDQLGHELLAASHPKADPYPSERDIARAYGAELGEFGPVS